MTDTNSAEAPRIDMQLIKNGKDVALDFIPAVNPGQYSTVRAMLLSEYGVPIEAPVFSDATLSNGIEYSVLSCSAVRAIAEERTEAEEEAEEVKEEMEHYSVEKRLAREIWQALANSGNAAELTVEVVPVERSHRLLDLS